MREIMILMHTHWDREWYFTSDETQVLLKNHMIEVIVFLERNPDVIYILDGQSVMIDDFLLLSKDYESRLKKLIENKQLRVGPWYTQTDLLIVSGESIIRNLLYGHLTASKYGAVMKVGYAPDTFGHSINMPQIYKMFEINSCFFWRGFSELKARKADFNWQGIDGSTIIGVNLACGYQGAKYLENDHKLLHHRMSKILDVLDKTSVSNARLIMNGHDQMPIQKNIHEIISILKDFYPTDRVYISDFETYLSKLDLKTLEVVDSELNHCKHARIHKTINSTRMDIKILNNAIETKIYNILEPLSILANQIGLDYPYNLIDLSLKELFKVHAHDSIGGCNSDIVNQDIKQRLIQIDQKLSTQIELMHRLISLSASSFIEGMCITIYNYLPTKRYNQEVCFKVLSSTPSFKIYDGSIMLDYLITNQDLIDAGLIDRQVAARLKDIKVYETTIIIKLKEIDGLSIKYLTMQEGEVLKKEVPSTNYIDNDYYKIIIDNNWINLYDKKEAKLYENIIYLENSGDAGDSYDYSPPHKDYIYNYENAIIKDIKYCNNDILPYLECDIEYLLPYDLTQRMNNNPQESVVFKVMLSLNDDLLKVNIDHCNKIKDSRYRLVFNHHIITNEIISDSHLCVVKKPSYLSEELKVWEEEKWVEKPISVETYQSFVQVDNGKKQASIFSKGLKEYEAIGGKIYLTLFRSFSHLGKRNLINRPGRPSGIEIETPDNQLIGECFSFELMFTLNKYENVAYLSKEFLTPIDGYQLKAFNRFNINEPEDARLIDYGLDIMNTTLVVSAIKYNKDKDIYIRLYNPSNKEVIVKLDNAYEADVYENVVCGISLLKVGVQKIKNIIIKKGSKI